MALSNMIFENNLGMITLTRIMYSINHSYTWSGGSGRANIEISVTGTVKSSEADLSAVVGKMSRRGSRGVLTLPSKTYENMKISGMSFQGTTWTDWGIVTLSFSDESESGENPNLITLTDGNNSVVVYEPKITVKPSSNTYSEKAIHMFDGYFRQNLGYDFLKISMSGIVIINDNIIPDSIFNTIEQKADNGLPRVGRLSSFIPEVANNIDPNHVMITDANIGWRVEKKNATISVNFMAPPQIITKVTL